MPVEVWLLGTAIVFTIVGMYINGTMQKQMVTRMIESTIDSLIADGYIKHYRDNKGEVELMKWWEETPKEVDNKTV